MNRRVISTAVAAALAAPSPVLAVKYKLSGQVSRAVLFQDDGFDSQVRNVDSQSALSGTRFRLKGSEALGNGVTVGFFWELQTSSNPASSQNPQLDGDTADGGNSGQLRQANVWVSGDWGKLTLGQTDGAGNATTEVDLSGTSVVLGHARTSHTAGMRWRTSAGGAVGGGVTAGATYADYDAFGKYDALRYDSPRLGPVALAASIGNASRWEVAGRLSAGLGAGRLSAALFYGEDHGRTALDNSRWGGSASYLFAQGTSLTAAYASNEQDARGGADADVYTLKLGHKWGRHAVSAQYSVGDDVTPGFEDSSVGVAYNLHLKRAATDVYAAYLHNELDVPAGTASAEDHDVVLIGARVVFD